MIVLMLLTGLAQDLYTRVTKSYAPCGDILVENALLSAALAS